MNRKKITVKEILQCKGNKKLTEVYTHNPLEAESCELAEIEMIISSEKNDIDRIRKAAENTFFTVGLQYGKYLNELDIFNRWGARIFSSNHLSGNEEYCSHNQQDVIGWDGTTYKSERIAQIGVYRYLINLEDVFGMPHQYMGQISLIR